MFRRHLLAQMLVIGVIASAIGIAVALVIDWFPVSASFQARKIDHLYDILLIASVPIFVLVEVVVLFSVWKFRMRPGEELKDGPPIHGNTTLEVIWTAVPAILLVSLCTYAYIVLRDIEKAPAKGRPELEVKVTGQQFAWSYAYKGPGGKSVQSNVLYLPEGQSVKFKVGSTDVIHSFWVPQFRLKVDAVPGITTSYRVTPSRRGDYQVVCAELCGLGHSVMRNPVHVIGKTQFRSWLATKGAAAQAAAG